jgi:hypothetical protein
VPRGDDAYCIAFAQYVDDEEKCPVLRQPDDSIALFATCSGVFNPKERVEEHLTGFLKGEAMLHEIGRCLIDIPKEALALIGRRYPSV